MQQGSVGGEVYILKAGKRLFLVLHSLTTPARHSI